MELKKNAVRGASSNCTFEQIYVSLYLYFKDVFWPHKGPHKVLRWENLGV